MPLKVERLVRIATAHAADIGFWKEGVSLQTDSGATIQALCIRVASGRWHLALRMRHEGEYALSSSPACYRTAISRYYYAMYHAIRAASYLHHGGDDHEKHSVLPAKIPTDFPNHSYWSNQLKSAREYRNNADYDPYPDRMPHWRRIAADLKNDASTLMPDVRHYLRRKGCRV